MTSFPTFSRLFVQTVGEKWWVIDLSIYMVAWRYEFYFLVLKTIFNSLAALVRNLPLENKIHISVPLCNILYVFWVVMSAKYNNKVD